MNFGIAYGIVLILFVIISFICPNSKKRQYLFISDFFLAIPAYFVKPASFATWDTIRFANLLDTMRLFNASGITNGLNWGLSESVYSNQPLVVFYIWVMSFFKNNGVFFYVNILLFLLILSLLINESLKKFDIKNNGIGVTIQFLVLMIFNLFFEVEGVRNFLAFDIFATAFYIDINSKSRKKSFICWVAYLIAFSFHPAVIPFIVFRIIISFKSKLLNFLTKIGALLYTFFTPLILSLLGSIPFIAPLISRSDNYLYGQSNYDNHATNGEIFFTTLILIYLIAELTLFSLLKMSKNFNQSYLEFYIICLLFTIGSYLNMQVYLRSIVFLLFLSIPLKAKLLSNIRSDIIENVNNMFLYLYRYLSIIFAVVMFIHWYMQTYSLVPSLSF